MLAEPACGFIWLEDGHVVDVRDGRDGVFRLLNSPALLARNTFGQGHVLLCLVDVEAKQFLLVGAHAVSREALDNVAVRAEVDALQKKKKGRSTSRRVPKIRNTV